MLGNAMPPAPQGPVHKVRKILGIVGLSILILLATLLVVKDFIIQTVITNVGSEVLGAPLQIDHFSWNVLTQGVTIRGLRILDPPGFRPAVLVDIPEVSFRYSLFAFLKGKVVDLPLVRVSLKEIIAIRNAEGKLNVDALKVLHPKDKTPVVIPPFKIEELKLNIGRVIFEDNYKKTPPQILVYDLDVKDKTLKNLDTIPKLASGIIITALGPTVIRSAGVSAAAAVLGIGFLPAAVLGVIMTGDSASAEVSGGTGKAFNVSENFIRKMGQVKKSDPRAGTINGSVQGYDVVVRVENLSFWKSKVTVSAHQFMLPKREFAGGIVYQIVNQLK